MNDKEIVNSVEDQLRESLGEWESPPPISTEVLADGKLSDSLGDPPVDDDVGVEPVDDDLPDDDQGFDERDTRIEELEADNLRLAEAAAEREDRRELDIAATYIAGQAVGVPFETIKSAILGEYVSDESFRDAYDNRGDDPVSWQFALEELVDHFPPGDHGMSAAVRASRDFIPSGGDGSDNRDWSGMSTQQFAVESRKVLKDASDGKLKPETRGGRGLAPLR